MTAPRPETRMAAMILEESDFHHTGCLSWTTTGREPCDCTLPLRLAEIEAEARAPLVARMREWLIAGLPTVLADIDDAGSDAFDWTGSEYVDRLADGILALIDAAPDAAPRPDYEARVQAMADALHADCRLEWQAIGAVGREATVTQHGADAHYGKAHDLVRRLWPELDTAALARRLTGDPAE